jgi:hypothetical protein
MTPENQFLNVDFQILSKNKQTNPRSDSWESILEVNWFYNLTTMGTKV